MLGILHGMYEAYSKHLYDSINTIGDVSVHYLDRGKRILLYVIDKIGIAKVAVIKI